MVMEYGQNKSFLERLLFFERNGIAAAPHLLKIDSSTHIGHELHVRWGSKHLVIGFDLYLP